MHRCHCLVLLMGSAEADTLESAGVMSSACTRNVHVVQRDVCRLVTKPKPSQTRFQLTALTATAVKRFGTVKDVTTKDAIRTV